MARDLRFSEIKKLADAIMGEVRNVIPVLSISLVACVIKDCGDQGFSAFEVESRVKGLIEDLQADGAPAYVNMQSQVESVLNALFGLQNDKNENIVIRVLGYHTWIALRSG